MKNFLLFLLVASSAFAFSKVGTIYTTDGSQSDVQAALNDSSANDTINIPSGTFTFGASAVTTTVSKAVTLQGQGKTFTTINISSSAASAGTGGVFSLTGGGTIRSFTIAQPGNVNATAFVAGVTSGWRITDIVYNSSTPTMQYFVYGSTAGVIDSCTLNSVDGQDEPIFTRFPVTTWASPASMGTVDAIYVEDCTFNGPGYPDSNTASRMVFRFNTVVTGTKFDGHGYASNSPARGVRMTEFYGNTWTYTTPGSWTAIEMRGGTGVIFNNTALLAAGQSGANIYLTEYGYLGSWGNFFNTYMRPIHYPIRDQIGCGVDVTVSATSTVANRIYQITVLGDTNWNAIGYSGTPVVGGQFLCTGAAAATASPGQCTTNSPAGEPVYVWNNQLGGQPWPRSVKTAVAGAITANGGVSYGDRDLIQADRDFFASSGFDSTYTFDGTGGMGTGTKAQMLTYTPTKVGVGFWVTDEGSWNTFLTANTSGQLYTWDGSAWVLKYTPYTYPHPARGAVANETTPPTPNPVTWSSNPIATAYNTIVGTATLVTDTTSNPVSYAFSVVPTGQATSWGAWQSGRDLLKIDATGSTVYDIRVKARDAVGNETTPSSIYNVTTPPTPSATKHKTKGRQLQAVPRL